MKVFFKKAVCWYIIPISCSSCSSCYYYLLFLLWWCAKRKAGKKPTTTTSCAALPSEVNRHFERRGESSNWASSIASLQHIYPHDVHMLTGTWHTHQQCPYRSFLSFFLPFVGSIKTIGFDLLLCFFICRAGLTRIQVFNQGIERMSIMQLGRWWNECHYMIQSQNDPTPPIEINPWKIAPTSLADWWNGSRKMGGI